MGNCKNRSDVRQHDVVQTGEDFIVVIQRFTLLYQGKYHLQGSHRICGMKFPDFSMIFPEFSLKVGTVPK